MAIGRTWAVSLLGMRGAMVEVEADVTQSLPRLDIIGLVDRSLAEAEGRVRLAAGNAGCRLPSGRITVNLSPASLPKAGASFDLAIAVAALAAGAQLDPRSVAETVHLGELGLDGRLRPTPGILPAVLAACAAGHRRVMVPRSNEAEARLVPEAEVIAVSTLREATILHGAQYGDDTGDGDGGDAAPPSVGGPGVAAESPASDFEAPASLADIIGQDDAVDALIAAAAGGHHLSLIGPPGAGKTMLASRLPGILPDLAYDSAVEVASVRSLAGRDIGGALPRRPPFQSPHHSSSVAALIGGGSGTIRPGAAALAAHGVLFLDEAPEFPAHVLNALRQPLESGVIVINRAVGEAIFPGRFQLILASNPCPCGQDGEAAGDCSCAPQAIRKYRARISGPLLDRIDIRVRVRPLSLARLRLAAHEPPRDPESTRDRVLAARARSRARLHDTPWAVNAQVPGSWLRESPRALASRASAPLDRALGRGQLSMRGYDRVIRLAWTLADLDDQPKPGIEHIGRALFLREG